MHCTAPDCQILPNTRGFCVKHYRRWLRHGDPSATKRIVGDTLTRYWQHVNKNGDIHPRLGTRCWLWTGHHNKRHGYGYININSKQVRSHRYAFFLEYGRWPNPCCRHKCDTRLCVRPEHLEEGTPADNNRDTVARGRSQQGIRHHNARLTNIDVISIRRRLAGGESLAAVSQLYSISRDHARRIQRRQRWGHLISSDIQAM